jgi:MGT family glycosyltransferase
MAAEFGVTITDPRTMDSPFIDICPPSLQLPGFVESVAALPTRPVPWSPTEALPPTLVERDRTRPLVYVTLGTVFAEAVAFRKIIAGVARKSVDVLVTTGPKVDAAQLGDLPGNVTVQSWVPQAAVLPQADVIVHHGGSGTMLGAAAHGVPQALLPMAGDQHTNAAAVVKAGCGIQLDSQHTDEDEVANAVHLLLHDHSIAASAKQLAAEIAAMPHPQETVARLNRELV